MNINEYKKRLPPVIVQSHLENQFDLIHKSLEIFDFYVDGMYNLWQGKQPTGTEIAGCRYINQQTNLDVKKKNLGATIYAHAKNVRKNIALLEQRVRYDSTTEVIVTKGMSLKQLALLIQLDSMYRFVTGTVDIYMYVSNAFMRTKLEGSYATTAREHNAFLSKRELFIRSMNAACMPPLAFKKVLDDATNVTITDANNVLLHDDLTIGMKNTLATTKTANFNQNPIMWIRSAFMGLFMETYNELDDKKRYLELSLRQLQNEQRNNKDPALDREMEMVKDRIRAAEYKMKKIMETSNE